MSNNLTLQNLPGYDDQCENSQDVTLWVHSAYTDLEVCPEDAIVYIECSGAYLNVEQVTRLIESLTALAWRTLPVVE